MRRGTVRGDTSFDGLDRESAERLPLKCGEVGQCRTAAVRSRDADRNPVPPSHHGRLDEFPPVLNHHPPFGDPTEGFLRAGISGGSAGSAHSGVNRGA
jgi:hypothetical protein